jgi:hypothetical protein
VVVLNFATRQFDNLIDGFINIQQLFLRKSPFGKAPDSRYHVTRTGGVLSDALDGLPCLFQVRGLSGEKVQTSFRVNHDSGERLIDLVGNQGGQFSKRRDARDVRELGLRLMRVISAESIFKMRKAVAAIARRLIPQLIRPVVGEPLSDMKKLNTDSAAQAKATNTTPRF